MSVLEVSIKSRLHEFEKSRVACDKAYDALRDKSTPYAHEVEQLSSFYAELIQVCKRALGAAAAKG